MIVVDASVYVDSLLPKLGDRHQKANEILEAISKEDLIIYGPKILTVELASVLSRKISGKIVKNFLEELTEEIHLIGEEDLISLAYNLAFEVRGRAVDLYYIAAAKITNSILITNDKTMAENAKRSGIEAYYPIDEFEDVLNIIRSLKGNEAS
ncbi:type II toxin-antitoxin system VapC family toxin [Candidatus Pyrohabitans sp.]